MNVLQHTRNERNPCLKQNRPDRSYRDTLLKAKIYELSTQKEKLRKRVENSEMECNRLQEELEKYINSRRRKYKGTKIIVP